MNTYTVYRSFRVECSRQISAETIAEAEQKARSLKDDRWYRAAPGAQITDCEDLSGMVIAEERE